MLWSDSPNNPTLLLLPVWRCPPQESPQLVLAMAVALELSLAQMHSARGSHPQQRRSVDDWLISRLQMGLLFPSDLPSLEGPAF